MHWIVIYPVESAIQHLNNRRLVFSLGARVFFSPNHHDETGTLKCKIGEVWVRQRERGGRDSLPFPSLLLFTLATTQGLLFLLSPIFLCQKIKDSSYAIRGFPLTKDTPALQANKMMLTKLTNIQIIFNYDDCIITQMIESLT